MDQTADFESEQIIDTGRLIRKRARALFLVIMVPLISSALLVLIALETNQRSNQFAHVFGQMSEAVRRLQTDVAVAAKIYRREQAAQESDTPLSDLHIRKARASFVEMLTYYAAIRVSDSDGAETGQSIGPESDLRHQVLQIYDWFDVDPVAANATLDIAGSAMPEELEELWEAQSWSDETGLDEALEVQIGNVAVLAAPLFWLKEPDASLIEDTSWDLQFLIETKIEQRLIALDLILKERAISSAKMPGYAVVSIVVLVSLSLLIGQLVILRPLERRISRHQTALVRSREKAKDSERAKADFLASMSHEIRTPMNGVMGMSELLSGTELDNRQRMFNDVVTTSAKSLLSIIDDILDFSRIEAGKLLFDEKPFKLSDLGSHSANLVAEKVASKHLDLAVRVSPDAPRQVVGDLGRLSQVMTNLVGNAVKFTRSGQIQIDISTRPLDPDPQSSSERVMVCVKVQDTGAGIPEDRLEHVFGRFSQVDNSSTREHEGTGLGLAISKGLVEQMGGEISVESVIGRGSTFRFEVPLGVAEAKGGSTLRARDLRGLRVLVIDDNEVNRMILREMLTAWQFDGAVAASGREGLQKLAFAASSGQPFDLVLLDHHMPGLGAEDVLRTIRSSPELAGLRVLLLSSIADDVSVQACHDIGLDGSLIKPALASPLFDAISMTLAQEVPAPASTTAETPASRSEIYDHSVKTVDSVDVLIVEDSEINRLLVEHVLTGMGLSFAPAKNGAEAISQFIALAPRVILMDVAMPGMNGLEATAKIRRLEFGGALDRTPIIGVTAHALSGARDQCLEAGMDDYISKPIDLDILRHVLDAALEKTEYQAAPQSDASAAKTG